MKSIFLVLISVLGLIMFIAVAISVAYGATLATFPNDKELASALDSKPDRAVQELRAILTQEQATEFYGKMVQSQAPKETLELLTQAKAILLRALPETDPVILEIDKKLVEAVESVRVAESEPIVVR